MRLVEDNLIEKGPAKEQTERTMGGKSITLIKPGEEQSGESATKKMPGSEKASEKRHHNTGGGGGKKRREEKKGN